MKTEENPTLQQAPSSSNLNGTKKNNHNRLKYYREKRRKEAKLEFGLYIGLWMLHFMISGLIPFYLMFLYYGQILVPYFLDIPFNSQIRMWDSMLYPIFHLFEIFAQAGQAFQNQVWVIIFLLTPLIFLGIYLLRLFSMALVMKVYFIILNRIRPPKELINVQQKGEYGEDVIMYHRRGFFLRFIRWQFTKSPFPWLSCWLFNFLGVSKIGKNVTVEDSYFCQEFLEMEDDTYIGGMSIVSSHLVEGKYGELTLKKVIMGKNSVIGAFNLVPPGTVLGENAQILPMSATLKFQTMKANSNYWGLPTQKITTGKYKKFIQLPEELGGSGKSENEPTAEPENSDTSEKNTNEKVTYEK